MLTQKKLATESAGQFSKSLLGWVAKNSSAIQETFSKKYPRARNKFNLEVVNVEGSKRILILTAQDTVKVDVQSAGRNVLPWATLRKLGCPVE